MTTLAQPPLKTAPSLADRLRGAIWGQFVGDAACLGTHWIYDPVELAQRYPDGIQGFEPPFPGHYHSGKASGDQTHYGDAALLLLESVAALGRFDAVDFGTRFVTCMASPDYAGYQDHATRGTLTNYRAFHEQHPSEPFDFQLGADDDQPATVTRLAPLVVAHYGDERLLEIVTAATRVCQNNTRAIAYACCHALILSALFDGQALLPAFETMARRCEATNDYGAEIAGKIREAMAARSRPVVEATLGFGSSCPLPSAFPAAIQAALAHEDDFTKAILATAKAGGDNAARAALIGSWLGAALGIDGISIEWRKRLSAYEGIFGATETIVAKIVQ